MMDISFLKQLHNTLDHFLLFNSDDYQTIKERISQYLCPHQFRVDASCPLNTRLNGFHFGACALYDLKYNAPVEITIDPQSTDYLFRLTLEGECQVLHAQQRVKQSPGIMTVSNPFSHNRIVTNHHCRNIILKLSRHAVEVQLFRMLGYSTTEPVVFYTEMSCTTEGINAIIDTLGYACHAYHHITHWTSISESFSQYLIDLILLKIPHNYSNQLNESCQQVMPAYVKKAIHFIRMNLQQNISLNDLSTHCEVSVRTLQKGFNHYLNQTPVEYIRDQRLERIHQQLQSACSEITVTDILLQNGINSFGHFSRIYKKRYGCLPSSTLKAALKSGKPSRQQGYSATMLA